MPRRRVRARNNDNPVSTATAQELRIVCKKYFRLTREDYINRENLTQHLSQQDPAIQASVSQDLRNSYLLGDNEFEFESFVGPAPSHSNEPATEVAESSARDGLSPMAGVVNTSEHDSEAPSSIQDAVNNLTNNRFMRVPDKETVDECISNFIKATSNGPLKTHICASCARECNVSTIERRAIDSIENRLLLKPQRSHPAHDIFFEDGLLLHPPGVHESSVDICKECSAALRRNVIPKFALSNNMWIGAQPFQLRGLTLPERIMISKHFPSAYIVKLHPKKKGARAWDMKGLHNGLRGNVSSYKLNPAQLADTILRHSNRNIFPPPAKILSATIGVTFVGPKGLPEKTMIPNTFRVRRWKVREALVWLKANNHLYKDIEISEESLAELPEDGIPEEIASTARFSDNVGQLEKEREGYVLEDDDFLNEDSEQRMDAILEEAGLVVDGHEDYEDAEDEVDPETYADSVPLQSLGIIDIDGGEISTSELMSHAFSNSGTSQSPDDFTIKRGSAFVNEYARTDSSGQRTDGGPSDPNHLLGCFPTLFPYGMGGFEVNRKVDIPYEAHAKWSMLYADRRFRKDYLFPHLVFGVCQKREVCRSTVLQMNAAAYERYQGLLASIKPEDLVTASQEEQRRVPFSNPAIRALRQVLRAVRTRVKGTDESRQHVR